MERVFSTIAYRKNEGFLYRVLLSPLYFISLLYGAAVKIRLALYSSGFLKTRVIGCKALSVGNITVGGTGKTPTVELIARRLQERGLRPAIISRGYKRKGKGIGIVSDGKDLLLSPAEAGDEPYMLARRLRNVPVLVGADRYALGTYALERFPLDVLILDDGFQHIQLKRDLDILIVDGEKGFGNSRLLPRGPLREPLSGIGRSGLVLINKTSTADTEIIGAIIKNHTEPVLFKSRYRAVSLVPLHSGEKKDVDLLSGAKVLALSAIAVPSSFLNLIYSLGAKIVSEVSFEDHHSYTPGELKTVRERAKMDGAEFVVTTEKDAVKLEQIDSNNDIPIYYLEIGLDMNGKEKEFIDSVISRISN